MQASDPRRVRVSSLVSLAATSAALASPSAAAAPGDPVGPPITVANGVFGNHVARAGNGRMVASYLTAGGYQARRYTADGQPDGPAITVAESAGGLIVPGGVSLDADGDFVAAWADYAQRQWKLRARRYGADGLPRDGVVEVGSTPARELLLPSVLQTRQGLSRLTVDMNADGDFAVLWSTYQTTFVGNRIACKYLIGAVCAGDVREAIRVRRYDRNGQPRGLPGTVASVSENSLDVGGVAGLNGGRIFGGSDVEMRSDGSALVAWSVFGSFGNAQRGRLYTRAYPASGSAGPAREIGTASHVYRADLRLDSSASGSYAIVHRTVDVQRDSFDVDCGVEIDRLAVDGTVIQPRSRVDETPFGFDCLSAPDVAMDAAGNHVVVFLEQQGIKARRYGTGGEALAGLFDVTPPETVGSVPMVAIDAVGNFVVGYANVDQAFLLQRYEGP